MIAGSVAKCEFKTFQSGKEVRKDDWYMLNMSPNNNQSKYEFIYKLITKLYENQEALVFQFAGQMFVADSFSKNQTKDSALSGDRYDNITIDQYTLQYPMYASQVCYFKLSYSDMTRLVDNLNYLYTQIITTAMTSYVNSNSQKAIISVDDMAYQGDKFEENYKKLIEEDMKNFLSPGDAALPLFDGMKVDLGASGSKENSRDIKAILDDITEYVAQAFNVPSAILRGNVADTSKAVDSLLTFCIDPLCRLLEEEFNRKLFGKLVNSGTKLKIDTKSLKHVDLLSVSTAIDKLISSGCFCIDDIRKVCGEEPLNTNWSKTYFMTKNYATVDELLNAINEETDAANENTKGGEDTDAKEN